MGQQKETLETQDTLEGLCLTVDLGGLWDTWEELDTVVRDWEVWACLSPVIW